VASKLDETANFLDLYLHCVGKWKTPVAFHTWAAMSLIAACVEDRVYIPGFEHSKLYPNLWVFLIGGSGVGKDHAIGFALSLLDYDDPLLVHDGKITIQGMYDAMAAHQKITGRDAAPMYLVSSDLPEQLPPGPESLEFTSRVMPAYGGRERKFADMTRTGGMKHVKNPLLNWIVGVVPRWFPRAIHPDVFHSGLAGRSMFVHGEKNQQYSHVRAPILPADYDLVKAHLRMRVLALQTVEGPVRFTKKALRILDSWLFEHSQQKPENEIAEAIHERKKVLVQKVATILCLTDWLGGEVVCRGQHVADAIQMLPMIERGIKVVGEYIYKTPDTQLKEIVEVAIRDNGKVSRSRLMTIVTARGIKDVRHFDAIIDMLIQSGTIERTREKMGNGKWVYFYESTKKRAMSKVLKLRRDARRQKAKEDAEAEYTNGPTPQDDVDSGGGDEGDSGDETDEGTLGGDDTAEGGD
jgi:hypothetical protein